MQFTPDQLRQIVIALDDQAEHLEEKAFWKSAARVWRLAADVYQNLGNDYDANLNRGAADKCDQKVARKTYRD